MTIKQTHMQPGRIVIPGKPAYDVKIAITFNTLTKETSIFVEKGTTNPYGMMTLCLQHAAMLNASINMATAPQAQGPSISEPANESSNENGGVTNG